MSRRHDAGARSFPKRSESPLLGSRTQLADASHDQDGSFVSLELALERSSELPLESAGDLESVAWPDFSANNAG